MSQAVREYFDKLPMDAEFGCYDLKREVLKSYPAYRFMLADTILRRLRENRYGKGYEIVCVKPNKSRYKKIKFTLKKGT
jgi:hypothetical protein